MDETALALAGIAHQFRGASITAEAATACKHRIIDAVACAASAADSPECARIRDFSAEFGHSLTARIWGTGQRSAPDQAAFANGAMIRFLDFNDTFLGRSPGHPSDMIGGLVGLAEALGRDGRSLIEATLAAYEIYCGLCDAADFDTRGLDQAMCAAVGASVGACRLLDQSADTTAQAIGLALAPNLHLFNVRCGALSDWKGLAGPNGVRNGIFAALLAARGITGPSGVIEGRAGLADLVGPLQWSFRGVEAPYLLRTSIKVHPACYYVQGVLDAVLDLRGEIDPEAVDDILVETYEAAFRATGSDPSRWAPENRETADHSLPFTVASTLREGPMTAASYGPSSLADPDLRALMARIRVAPDAAYSAAFPDELAARITVRRTDGSIVARERTLPLGHHRNPADEDRIRAKFLDSFGAWGDADAAGRALSALLTLETQTSVAHVVDGLCCGS